LCRGVAGFLWGVSQEPLTRLADLARDILYPNYRALMLHPGLGGSRGQLCLDAYDASRFFACGLLQMPRARNMSWSRATSAAAPRAE
jgi:hypothetical protein